MNRKFRFFGLVGAMLMAAGLSCRDRSAPPPTDPDTAGPASAQRREYQVKGVVKELLPDRNRVRIAHEEIPNYMMAMTMVFEVKDPEELEGLQTGDEVAFRMIVTPGEGWIDQVKKVGHISQVSSAVPSTFRLVRDVDPLEEGDPLPDYTFTNELGQAMSLADFKGQAVAFTFVFTRCPFPNFCPRMATNFAMVYQQLKERPDAPQNWHLFTITMDPQFDTPLVLKTYAYAYGHDPERWNFLTAPLMDITAIGEQVGLQFYWDPNEPGSLNHNLRTVVVNPDGTIQKILVGNEWKPEELVAEMLRAMKRAVVQ